MKLLFTCMGTSDPVRGYHDGPMLHIIRHYRPEVICVFLSGEAAALDGCGARLDTVLSHIQNNWGGYAPELRVVRTQIDDPSDMDAVGAPITEAVAALTEEFPDGEVLLNLSSGTPQMKIALAFLAADLRRSMRGIQVKNFERAPVPPSGQMPLITVSPTSWSATRMKRRMLRTAARSRSSCTCRGKEPKNSF